MSTDRYVVSDTGPVISLEKLSNRFGFIQKLFDRVIVPESVMKELISPGFEDEKAYLENYGVEEFIEIRNITKAQDVPEAERLHKAEFHAIQLALELKLPLLIEETLGRRIARNQGIQISGIAGLIVKANHQQLITAKEARKKLEELLLSGRINRTIYDFLRAKI